MPIASRIDSISLRFMVLGLGSNEEVLGSSAGKEKTPFTIPRHVTSKPRSVHEMQPVRPVPVVIAVYVLV